MKIDASKLETFEACDAADRANRNPMTGKLLNEALHRRIGDRVRDIAIQILGMQPEDRTSYATRYAGTTGEFRKWANEELAKKAANAA